MHKRAWVSLPVLLFSTTAFAQENTAAPAPTNAWNIDPHATQGASPAPRTIGHPAPQPYPPQVYPPAYPGTYAFPEQTGWQHAAYESQKRSAGIALLLEFFIPGVGSIYGDHLTGALINWGLELAGLVIIIDSFNMNSSCNNYSSSYSTYCEPEVNSGELLVGLGLLLGGRIYGLVDAYSATNDYNLRLRRQMGLPDWVAFGIAPIRSGRNDVAYSPTLRLRF